MDFSKKVPDQVSGLTRRRFMQGSAMAAAAYLSPLRAATAQQKTELRVMTLQGSPEQLKAYAAMVAAFEAVNPDIKVSIEPVNEAVLWPKLAAAYAGHDVPDLVLQMTAPPVCSLYGQGLLLPMDDVVKEVGEADFEPNALSLYKQDGSYFAAATSNNCVSLLWYRTDLLKEAGLDVPKTWDEYLTVAKALTKGGVYGAALPYGTGAMTNSIFWTLTYQAGGTIIDRDNNVTFDSEPVRHVLEFLREMRPFCPPGANRYDFAETLGAYVSGASATTIYTGRAIGNTVSQNPEIADYIACAPYPYMKGGTPWWSGAFEASVIPKGAKQVEAAKKFAVWNYKPETYIKFINATPGHQIPTLKSVLASKEYRSNPLLERYSDALEVTINTLSKAHATCKPFDDFPLILKAGEIQGSGVFAQVVQRVVVEKQDIGKAMSWGQDQIARIMKA